MFFLNTIGSANRNLILFFSLLFFGNLSIAQNLLTNGDFEQGNNLGFSSNYTFVTPPVTTGAGQYGIGINPQPYNTSFISMGDHTTGNGNMMIVDGTNNSGNPEPFFWKVNNNGEICGLTTGITYTFSYWIKSIYTPGIPGASVAQVRIKWNNIQGGQFISPVSGSEFAPAPGTDWQKVTYQFIPTNGCVRIEMFDQNGSFAGNDFAVDDFELIPPPEPLSLSASLTNVTCPSANDGVIVAYGKGGKSPYSYALSGPSSQTSSSGIFTGLAHGTYSVTVTDQNSNTALVNAITITQPADITVSADKTTICSGDQVNLSASGVTSYSWSASPTDPTLTQTNIANPVVRPTQTTTYTITSTLNTTQQLIYNGNFSLGDRGFFTDYKFYASNSSGLQRAYGIVTNSNTWFSGFAACTGNGGSGNMMVFDGSTINNDKVWCQKVPVKPGQTYTFTYFVQSLVTSNLANLEVQINGVSLTPPPNPQSAPSTTCSWQQRTYTWNSGASTMADICIYNRVTTSGGNDFALDDISFTTTLTCNLSKNITINVNNNTAPTFPTYGPFCQGAILTQPILPTTSTNGITGSWSPAALSANTPGDITYTFTPKPGQCAVPTSFVLKVNPPFNLTASATQNTNCSPAPCSYTGKKVVINELHIQPSASVGNQMVLRSNLSVGAEWIELYNPSPCQSIDLSCHMIGNYSTEDNGTINEPAILFLPPGTIIPPLGFLTIGGGASVATLKPSSLINGLVGNQLYLPGGIFDGGWIGIWDVNGAAIDAVYWMDGTRNINSGTATASFTTSPGTITNANVPFSCPYRGTLPTARALANSGGPITRIGNIASNGTYQFRTSDGASTWTFNNVANTPSACNSTCATPFTGGCSGTATVTVTGGTSPFTYQWNDPAAQTTQTATGLCGGTYTVTVKDANNACTQTANITVTDNCCSSITNASLAQTICTGGNPSVFSVSTSATGTNAISFKYFTTPQTGTNMYSGGTLLGNVTPVSGMATYDADVLGATGSLPNIPGTYYVYAIANPTPSTITCRPSQQIIVTVNAGPLIYPHGENPTCGCDGKVTIDVSGGSAPYEYSITGSSGTTTQPGVNAPSYTFTNQCAGTYTVQVKDQNGCTSSASTPVVGSCPQIQSILVDACSGIPLNPIYFEQDEEMVFFQTGSNPLNVNAITTTWPNTTNTWRGLCSNAATAQYIAAANASITKGGTLIAVTPTGTIPANSNVVLITGSALNVPLQSFSNLSGPLYVLFQCNGNTAGHFSNGLGTGTRTLTMNFGGGCTDAVTYDRALLPNSSAGGLDGNYVNFTINGSATYFNYGCTIPYTIQTDEVVLSGAATLPVITAITAPAALCENGTLNPTAPSVTDNGSPLIAQDWEIESVAGSGTFIPLSVPYIVAAGDNGKKIRYTATNSCGTSRSNEITIIVNVNPTVAAIVSPATICESGSLSLSTPVITNNGSVVTSEGWEIESSFGSATFIPFPAPYAVVIADNGKKIRYFATNSCGKTTSNEVVITVNNNRTVNAGSPIPAICQGATSVGMGGSVGGGATGGTWSGGAGTWTNASDPANATYTASSTESGVITLTLTTSGGSCGTTTATKTITVNANPTVSAGPSVSAICQGATSIAMGGSVGGGATGGTWSGGAGTWTNENNPATATYTAGATESGSITLTLTTSGGLCGTTTATKTITVNANPTAPTLTVTQPNCGSPTGSVTLSGLPSVSWTINPGSITGSGNSYQINNLTPNTYSYTVRDANGCTSLSSNSVTISAASAPPAVPAATVTRQPDCVNSKGSITVNSPLGNLLYSLNGGTPQSSPLFDNLDGGSYSIVAEDPVTGCKSPPSVFYTINAAPLPSVAPFVGIAEEYCVGDLAVPVRALGQPQGQLWWYANATGGTGTTTAPVPSTVSDGTRIYYVTQRIPGFCESPRVALTVIVHPLPLADAGGDKEIVRGQRTRIDGQASGNGISVLWTPGFGLSDAKITTPVASPEQTTVYTLTVTSVEGCKSTDNMRVLVKEPRVVKIPNVISPNGDGVHDRWVIGNMEDYPDAEVQIFNRYGTQVYEVRGYDNANGWDGKLNGADLPVGAYYYIIRLNGKVKPIAGVISIIR